MQSRTDLDSLLTSNDSKMELTAGDICKIIKSCKDHSVLAFEYGNLKVKFNLNQLVDAPTQAHSLVRNPTPEEIDKSHREEEKFLLSETVLTKEAELLQLQTLHPEKYEDLAFSGDLVDGRRDTPDDIGP